METPNGKPDSPNLRLHGLRPISAVALSAAMVWSTAIAAWTWKDVRKRPEKHTIRVTGSAKKRIVSDLIQWEAVLEARAPDRTAAYRILREARRDPTAVDVVRGGV
jgi:hypothetical protein